MQPPKSLEEFIEFIRSNQGISQKIEITSASLLGKDLRITGDDGDELLYAIQKRYGVSFIGADGSIREAFDLNAGEFLFESEPNIAQFFTSLFGGDSGSKNVKPLTVGELHRITCSLRDHAASPVADPSALGDHPGNA